MKIEWWKYIPGYEGLYMVSNLGRIKSCDRYCGKRFYKGHILPLHNNGKGYLQVRLSKNGKQKNYKVHRLVVLAFIPNPNNLPCVNHKNENKLDNRVENLEWCTIAYNNSYGTSIERNSKKRINGIRSTKINQLTLDGELVRVWPSMNEIKRELNFSLASIHRCCNNLYKQAYGYIWRYA